MSLYTELTAANVPVDHHESDLYFPSTPASEAILANYPDSREIARYFRSNIEGTLWLNVPFAYDPFWESRCEKTA